MSVFKDLRKELRKYLHKDQITEIERAFVFAEQKHVEQKRRSGEPYIIHPTAVAKILAGMQLDSKTIMAALLHDVLEDTVLMQRKYVPILVMRFLILSMV